MSEVIIILVEMPASSCSAWQACFADSLAKCKTNIDGCDVYILLFVYGIRLLVLQAKLSGIAVGDGWIDPINMIPGQHTLTLTRTRTRTRTPAHARACAI